MVLLNTCSKNSMRTSSTGFSLIEVVLVLSLCSLVASWALFASFTSIGRASSRRETEMLLLLLQKARANSMSNIDAWSWGICTIGNTYRFFSGTSYAARSSEEILPIQSTVTGIDCTSGGVVFEQLSGRTVDTTVHIFFSGTTTLITINHEGRIETN